MRKPDNSLSASHTVCIGSTGSGKSSWLKKHRLGRERSILVWDGKDEYEQLGYERITTWRGLHARLARSRTGKIAFAVKANRQNFEFWARAAWAWGHCLAIAEELADVTTPGKASQDWGELVRKGRAHGIRTVSTTSRPQEIDKTLLGAATDVMVGFQSLAGDRDYVAKNLGFPRDRLEALEPGDTLYRVLPRGDIQTGRAYPKARARRKRAATTAKK